MKIDWVAKLTSRKFWAAVAAFVTSVLTVFRFAEGEIAQVTGLIMSGATVIAYIIGEGIVDAASAKQRESTEAAENNSEKSDSSETSGQ